MEAASGTAEKVESDQSVLVPYGGPELEEEKEYRVSLQLTDNYGSSAQAETVLYYGDI